MYCTIQNIKDLIPEKLLEWLTSGNDSVIEKAIEGASSTVDAYLMGSYNPEEASHSAFLQAVAEKIAVYNIYLVSASDDTPQIVITSYLEAISSLEKLQNGLLSVSNTEKERQSEVFINKAPWDKLFGKENLKKF